MILESLVKPLYSCVLDINRGIYLDYDLCGAKYASLVFCNKKLWSITKYHHCNKCIIPMQSIIINTDEAMEVMNDLINDDSYSQLVTNNISLILNLAKVKQARC